MHKLIYNCTNGKRVAINIDNFNNVCTISCVKNKIHKQLRDIFKQTNKKLNNILAFINSFPLFFENTYTAQANHRLSNRPIVLRSSSPPQMAFDNLKCPVDGGADSSC